MNLNLDNHFIKEKIQENLIFTSYVRTGDQLANLFAKAKNGSSDFICNKLGIINIHNAPA